MGITSILTLLGGIGLFLYGMHLLSNSVERMAGAKFERVLEKLTSNRVKGVLLGAGVTAIIQSSAATIIMVVGFLNAGIMRLIQALPVILGANIGTCATAQILRLGDISGDNIFLLLLKPSSFAPLCVALGAAILLIAKSRKYKDRASIIMGFGILFLGMTTMEATLAPLKESAAFQEFFMNFNNPLLGVLIGITVTVILQSSSASVGVLQALSSTGAVTFSMMAPIVIGQNVGKCATVLLGSIGTNKNARRAVILDLLMNTTSAVLFLGGIYLYQGLVGFNCWNDVMNRGTIANFHTLFNCMDCIIMFPFLNQLAALSKRMIKDGEQNQIDKQLALLDPILAKTPAVALQQCKKVIVSMGEMTIENLKIASELQRKFDEKKFLHLMDNEEHLDRTETVLGDYLVNITEHRMIPTDNRLATEIMHSLGDFERIGDHCVNLAEVAQYNSTQGVNFSEEGFREVDCIFEAAEEILNMTVHAYKTEDPSGCVRVEPLEKTIDEMVDILKAKHIERLKGGTCTTQGGISFVELLTNIERISDHCSNISIHISQRFTQSGAFDTHTQKAYMRKNQTVAFDLYCKEYAKRFLEPLKGTDGE